MEGGAGGGRYEEEGEVRRFQEKLDSAVVGQMI